MFFFTLQYFSFSHTRENRGSLGRTTETLSREFSAKKACKVCGKTDGKIEPGKGGKIRWENPEECARDMRLEEARKGPKPERQNCEAVEGKTQKSKGKTKKKRFSPTTAIKKWKPTNRRPHNMKVKWKKKLDSRRGRLCDREETVVCSSTTVGCPDPKNFKHSSAKVRLFEFAKSESSCTLRISFKRVCLRKLVQMTVLFGYVNSFAYLNILCICFPFVVHQTNKNKWMLVNNSNICF